MKLIRYHHQPLKHVSSPEYFESVPDWYWLILIGTDVYNRIGAACCWLILIDAEWYWLMPIVYIILVASISNIASVIIF